MIFWYFKKAPALIVILFLSIFFIGTKTVQAVSIGDSYQGGVVAYILQSGDSGYDSTTQKGLIAATGDQSTSAQWSNLFSTAVGTTGTALGAGPANTTAIRNQPGEIQSAAAICNAYSSGGYGYGNWYLPSRGELAELYNNQNVIGGFSASSYWSSSEAGASLAWFQNFNSGSQSVGTKVSAFNVRCVRSFVAVTDISSAGVTGFVAPATGGTPESSSSLTAGSAEYAVTGLTWAPTDNPFNAPTQYIATVTLTSASGYEFPVGGIASPTGDGDGTVSAGTTTGIGSGNTLMFTVTFPETSNLVLSSAVVSGATLTLTYNEPLDPNSIPDVGNFLGDFVVDVNSSSVGLQNITITNDTVVITLSNPVMVTDSVTISYTTDSNPLKSLSNDQAISFSSQSVTTTPSAPFSTNDSSLNPTAVSSTEIDLTWSDIYDGGSPITGYEIDRSVGGGPGGGSDPFVPIAYPAAGDTSYSDTGLAPGTQYNYQIIAINAVGPGTPLVYNDVATDAVFAGGDGSPDDPFQITTCAQFEELPNTYPIGAYFLLEKDLDCSGEGNAITVNFLPFFMGRVDGGGHRITIATTDGEGLFHATGSFFVVKNLWVAGTITGATGSTGGVVDNVDGGSILNVKSTVTITGSGRIGGIVGTLALPSATIQDSYFDGTINASGSADEIGGIVGRAIRGQYIQNSYSAGTITETGSNAIIGGIWGYSISSFQGYPANDFSAIVMSATGSNEAIGGLFGFVGQEYLGYIDNFWDVTTTGQTSCSASGVTSPYGCNPENTDGNNPDFFKNTLPGGPFAAWNFPDTWKTVADGYPELSVFGTDPTVTSVTPTDGSTDVSTSANLVVNFSEPMDTTSLVTAASPCGGNGCPSFSEQWSNNDQTITLTPTGGLLSNTLYTVQIYSVLSADGFSPTSRFQWSFTTAPLVPVSGIIGGGCQSPNVWNSTTFTCTPASQIIPSTVPSNPAASTRVVPSASTATSNTYHFTRTLIVGMKGDDVVVLQNFLKVTPTKYKYFGLQTKLALIKYQKLHSLMPDGILGIKTEASIESVMVH